MPSNMSKPTIEKVYAQYWKELYVVAYRRLKSGEEVEDMLQDIFLSLVQKPEVLDREGSVQAYLHQALKYKIIDYFRKSPLRLSYPQEELPQVVSPSSSDEKLLVSELEQRVEEEVLKMPEKMQQVYRLSRKEQLSTDQIAHLLGLSSQTVKNQLSSALKRLRSSLHDYTLLLLLMLSLVIQG